MLTVRPALLDTPGVSDHMSEAQQQVHVCQHKLVP